MYLLINLIHRLKIVEIRQKHVGFNNIVQSSSGSTQDFLDIVERSALKGTSLSIPSEKKMEASRFLL
jgi:hypothetical protein